MVHGYSEQDTPIAEHVLPDGLTSGTPAHLSLHPISGW